MYRATGNTEPNTTIFHYTWRPKAAAMLIIGTTLITASILNNESHLPGGMFGAGVAVIAYGMLQRGLLIYSQFKKHLYPHLF